MNNMKKERLQELAGVDKVDEAWQLSDERIGEMLDLASHLRREAKGSFGALIIAAMMQSNAKSDSKLAKAFPNIYKIFSEDHPLRR